MDSKLTIIKGYASGCFLHTIDFDPSGDKFSEEMVKKKGYTLLNHKVIYESTRHSKTAYYAYDAKDKTQTPVCNLFSSQKSFKEWCKKNNIKLGTTHFMNVADNRI
jgi:hypothetical protein